MDQNNWGLFRHPRVSHRKELKMKRISTLELKKFKFGGQREGKKRIYMKRMCFFPKHRDDIVMYMNDICVILTIKSINENVTHTSFLVLFRIGLCQHIK